MAIHKVLQGKDQDIVTEYAVYWLGKLYTLMMWFQYREDLLVY